LANNGIYKPFYILEPKEYLEQLNNRPKL